MSRARVYVTEHLDPQGRPFAFASIQGEHGGLWNAPGGTRAQAVLQAWTSWTHTRLDIAAVRRGDL